MASTSYNFSLHEAKREVFRIASFEKYSYSANLPFPAVAFARAGFYYVGPDAVAKCFSCGNFISFDENSPQVLLGNHNPRCLFKQGKNCGNIKLEGPLQRTPSATGNCQLNQKDFSSRQFVDAKSNSFDDDEESMVRSSLSPGPDVEERRTCESRLNWKSPVCSLDPAPNYVDGQNDYPTISFAPDLIKNENAFNFSNSKDQPSTSISAFETDRFRKSTQSANKSDISGSRWLCPSSLVAAHIPTHTNDQSPLSRHFMQDFDPFFKVPKQKDLGTDVCGALLLPETELDTSNDYVSQKDKNVLKALYPCKESRFPAMVYLGQRIGSFKAPWPDGRVNTSKVAEAGFFYLGVNDHVRCFCCGEKCMNWSVGSDPWKIHAKFHPSCEYLLRNRGNKFVSDCHDLHSFETDELPIENSHSAASTSSSDHRVLDDAAALSADERAMLDCFSNMKNLMEFSDEEDQILQPSCASSEVGPRDNLVGQLEDGMSLKTAPTTSSSAIWNVTSFNQEYLREKVNDVMASETAARLLGMGYQMPHIKKVVKQIIGSVPRHVPTLEELIDSLETIPEVLVYFSDEESSRHKSQLSGTTERQRKVHERIRGLTDPADDHRKLIEERKCRICKEEERSVVFLPCRHTVCCRTCGEQALECPICHYSIDERMPFQRA
ncbi:uncharacterized protein LOC143470538 [Clavelina lepadiformis]|uniref:uncharacterized protein LOC143470538 n=1 Tax=Clavelina lepadiformis TaxID=159417 RepID=UPI004042A67E